MPLKGTVGFREAKLLLCPLDPSSFMPLKGTVGFREAKLLLCPLDPSFLMLFG
jgi:hypothetical protein